MTHRTFRLGIGPGLAGEPVKIFDFDGRSTLQQVQLSLRLSFDLELEDPKYAFLVPNSVSGAPSRYVDPRMVGLRADKAMLFRLGLKVGQRLLYVCDFGDERHYSVTVLSIRDAPVALRHPQLIEVPAAPAVLPAQAELGDDRSSTQPAALVPLAKAVSAHVFKLRALRLERDARVLADEARLLSELGSLALELGTALGSDLSALVELERLIAHPTLTLDVLSLPLELARASQTELALRVARAFEFAARDELRGDIALIFALAGSRDEALACVQQNLAEAIHRYVAEFKAGDVYRALGELDAAEVYYRRSLAETQSPAERSEASLRLTSFLLDVGRERDAASHASAESELDTKSKPGA